MNSHSIVEYFAEHEAYKCGYCGNKDTNFSHGMWAHAMTVQDYEDLIDRGWRRSGSYVYKPTMNQTCCPQYPIRCEVLDFKISKSQKKVIRKVNRFLNTGIKPKISESQSADVDGVDSASVGSEFQMGGCKGASDVALSDAKAFQQQESSAKSSDLTSIAPSQAASSSSNVDMTPEVAPPESRDVKAMNVDLEPSDNKAKKYPRAGEGADPLMPTCKKAKLLRKQKALEKQANRGESAKQQESKKADAVGKTIEELLGEVNEKPAHKLEVTNAELIKAGKISMSCEH